VRPPTATLLAALVALALTAPAEATSATGRLAPAAGSSWQADPAFPIEWDPIAPANPTGADYRIYDSRGRVVQAFEQPLAKMLWDVEVPTIPDAYTLEAWVVNGSGDAGPHSTATLRFDNGAPPPPGLESPPGWIRSSQPAEVGVTAPSGPLPLSGLGGFAIAVDRTGVRAPCARVDRCLAAELDLAGDQGGGISLGTLPEGTNFIRAVAVSGAGVPSEVTTAVLRVDGSAPALSLEGAPASWSNRPVLVAARAADALSGMAAAGPLGPFTAIAVDGAPPARALGGAIGAWVGGSGHHTIEYLARDAAGNISGNSTGTVRIDEDPPGVAFAATQDPAEPERIEATVSDPLSGPSPNLGSIALRLSGTRARFQSLPTRVSGGRLVAHWESDSAPPGKYEFLATAYDAAGNSSTGSGRARGGRMVLVNPLKAQVELAADLSRLRFSGRLVRVGGGPVAAQEVVVTETFARGSLPPQRSTVVGTDRRGAFSLQLGPGPSREVVARFAGTPLLSRAASDTTQLSAATGVRFRASAPTARVGGKPVVFDGTVRRRGAAAVAGLPVELQFRFRGGTWSEFRTVEADARGRFRYRYRFNDDDSRGVRFQFRAYIKGREGWPYGPGTSRPVSVTGR